MRRYYRERAENNVVLTTRVLVGFFEEEFLLISLSNPGNRFYPGIWVGETLVMILIMRPLG